MKLTWKSVRCGFSVHFIAHICLGASRKTVMIGKLVWLSDMTVIPKTAVSVKLRCWSHQGGLDLPGPTKAVCWWLSITNKWLGQANHTKEGGWCANFYPLRVRLDRLTKIGSKSEVPYEWDFINGHNHDSAALSCLYAFDDLSSPHEYAWTYVWS